MAVALALAGQKVLVIDLDLQFGDVGLCLGLAPEKTMYDLALSGGSLDEDKLADYVMTHETGVDVLLAPARPDQASAITIELLRDILVVARSTLRPGDRGHAAGLHCRGHRDDRRKLRPRHGRNTGFAVVEEHEAWARDARADGLRRERRSSSSSTAPTPASGSASTTLWPFSGASRTSSSPRIARSRARSTRAFRSTLSRPQSYAAASFHDLAALFTDGPRRPRARRGRVGPASDHCFA